MTEPSVVATPYPEINSVLQEFLSGVRANGNVNGGIVDENLEPMTRERLITEARRLRAEIRAHRDSTGHALCSGD